MMAGLFDFASDNAAPLLQGLLGGVGGALASRGNRAQAIGSGLLGAVGGFEGAQQNAAFADYRRAQAADKQASLQAQVTQRDFLSQDPVKWTPEGFARAGFTPEEAQGYMNLGKNKIHKYQEVRKPDGSVGIVGFDEFGDTVDTNQTPWEKPQLQNLGNRVGVWDPVQGKLVDSLGVGVSPDAALSAATSRRGQDLADARAREVNSIPSLMTKGAPQGYRWTPDNRLEAIPGGPADIKAGDLGAKRDAQQKASVNQVERVINKVDEALGNVGFWTSGLGAESMAFVGGTDARDLSADLETIKANLGFAELQAMRDASPTGGALGQVAVQELQALQSTIASLDQGQSAGQLKNGLNQVKRHYGNWLDAVKQAQGGQAASGTVPAVGTVQDGYRFIGGDPASQTSWERL